MIVTLTNKQHTDRSVQFHWIDLKNHIFTVVHDTTFVHELSEIINANAHTGMSQIDGWTTNFDADTEAKITGKIRQSESKTVDQEIEEIKAKAQEAILDAYHDRDRDTMKRLGWIVEIINLVQQQQAEKDQK
tara:strand:- start:156 stop:551 length:396 start_codon:yes stop_codon:yes gene_type:complete